MNGGGGRRKRVRGKRGGKGIGEVWGARYGEMWKREKRVGKERDTDKGERAGR